MERSPTYSFLQKQPTRLEQDHRSLNTKLYSLKAEKSYVRWIESYVFFHGKNLI